MPNKDYYKILGLGRGASEKEIKEAYKSGAKKYHPDRQQGKTEAEKKDAEDRFKEINEAYQVLSDPQKKQMYDTYGTVDGMGGMSADDAMEAFMRHMHAGMFGGGFEDFFGGRSRGDVVRGSDIKLSVNVSLSSVMKGGKQTFTYARWAACDACGGTGSSDGKTAVCPDCNGTGRHVEMTRRGFATFQNITVCSRCGGSGHSYTNPCKKCGGSGVFRSKETLTVDIPHGLLDRSYITVNGGGNYPQGGGAPGDLYVIFNIDYPDGFSMGNDPFDINLSIYEPVLNCITGGDVMFKHADGRTLKFKMPQCSEDGRVVRLKNEGLRRPDGSKGRLNVIIHHKMPKNISKAELKAINKLKDTVK